MFITSEPIKIDIRDRIGKTETRKMRKQEQIPGIVYGQGENNIMIQCNPKDLTHIKSYSDVFWIDVDGAKKLVVIKELQKHPITRQPFHIDFKVIKEEELIEVKVPVHFIGKAEGVALGGVLNTYVREIPIRCLPRDIPSHIDIDVTPLGVNQILHVKDLPQNETLVYMAKDNAVLAWVKAKEEEIVVAEDEAAEAAVPAADAKSDEKSSPKN